MTVKIHHGGHIVFDYDGLRYAGGEIRYFDWVSKNRLNLLQLQNFANQLGYPMDVEMDYWYQKLRYPGQVLKFHPIFTSEDIVSMCSGFDEDRVAYLYMVQRRTLSLPVDYSNSVTNHLCNTHSAIIISDGPIDTKREEEEFDEVHGNQIYDVQCSTGVSSNQVDTVGNHGKVGNLSEGNHNWETFKHNPIQWGRGQHGSSSQRAKRPPIYWDLTNSPVCKYNSCKLQ